jgi:hypothetical protein
MVNMAAIVENRGRPRPLKYKAAVQKIKARSEIQKLYNALSTSAVHVEKSMSQRFTLNGKSYPAMGLAIDPDMTRRVMRSLGTHLRRDTVIPQWFQASKAAAASDGHAVHC